MGELAKDCQWIDSGLTLPPWTVNGLTVPQWTFNGVTASKDCQWIKVFKTKIADPAEKHRFLFAD